MYIAEVACLCKFALALLVCSEEQLKSDNLSNVFKPSGYHFTDAFKCSLIKHIVHTLKLLVTNKRLNLYFFLVRDNVISQNVLLDLAIDRINDFPI